MDTLSAGMQPGTPAQLSPGAEFRRGWGIIVASTFGIGLGLAAMPTYSMGLFAPQLVKEFHWSVGQIMASMTIVTMITLFAGPIFGSVAERVGARRIVLIGLPLWGLVFASLSFSTASLGQFYLTWALLGVVGAMTLPITFTRAVNRSFDAAKGLALGLSMTGTGLFGIFGKPFLGWVIAHHGWRAGFFALGMLPILIALPIAFVLFREDDSGSHGLTHAPGERPGLTLGEALREWRFWLIAIVLIPLSFALGGPVPNLELILRDGGLTAQQALTITPLMGMASICGRLVGGFLLDRIWAPLVGFVLLSMPAIAFMYFAGGHLTMGASAVAVFSLSFAVGIEYDLISFFVARYFGLRRYGAIYGVLYVCFGAGAGLGPMFFGHDHDVSGNFSHILTFSAMMLVPCAACFLALGRYRQFED